MSDPDRYIWRPKEDFRAAFNVSNSTIDRYVKNGKLEKKMIGVKPAFRWTPDEPESALVPVSDNHRVILPAEAYNDLVIRLDALSAQVTQLQQMLQSAGDAKPKRRRSWWQRLLYGDFDP